MISRTKTVLHATALLAIAAVGVALVSQYFFDMQPCAWCVLQRLIFLAIAVVCWLSILMRRCTPIGPRIGAALVMVLSIAGAVSAWYQYTVASNMFSCDMTFADRFIAGSGLDATLPWLFGIYATCMEARVQVLGIEYSLWSMTLFVLMAIAAVYALLRNTD